MCMTMLTTKYEENLSCYKTMGMNESNAIYAIQYNTMQYNMQCIAYTDMVIDVDICRCLYIVIITNSLRSFFFKNI